MQLISVTRDKPLKELVQDIIYDYGKVTHQVLAHLMAASSVEEPSATNRGTPGQSKVPFTSVLPSNRGNMAAREGAGQVSGGGDRVLKCLNSFDSALQDLLELDFRLRGVIKTAIEHQKNQAKLAYLQAQSSKEVESIQTIVDYLQQSKRSLSQLIDSAHRKMESYRQASAKLKDPKVLLGYSSRIRKHTAAPPNYDPANPDMVVEPPYPDELLMRSGILADDDANKLLARAEEIEENAASSNLPVVFHFVPPVSQVAEVKSSSQFLSPGGNLSGGHQASAAQDAADDEDFFFDLNADLE
ncbi:hypothetical protein DSO57_1027648 [Entomophthora muscae]|uniref:Uncharacterized protein n=1 Tax=Entomophthora muscae TaxID=34485 RepID=A0ACC2TCY1_9FUNG|nr:hypothetical protein DSO57_1027648 [Entomophthora muscae]